MSDAPLVTYLEETILSLVDHEGFRDRPYEDTVGVLTFGHGLTYITEEESLLVMRHRLLNEYLPRTIDLFPTWESLSDARKIVLLNMCYNLGPSKLSHFYRMRAAIDIGDFDEAAVEMLDSTWARQVGDMEGERAFDLSEIMRNG